MTRRVVITGRAISSPLGYTLAENQQGWFGAKHAFTALNSEALGSRFVVGMCPPPDTSKLPDRKIQKVIIRKDLIGFLTVLGAAKDCGYVAGKVDPDRFGIYVGSGSTQVSDLNPYVPLIAKSTVNNQFSSAEFGKQLMGAVNPMVMLQNLMNNTLCYSSIALDARGVNANFMDFQAAGIRAVIEGYHSISQGRADFVIAGGVACTPDPPTMREGQNLGYLAQVDDALTDYASIVRPYDASGAGTVLSEGSVFVALEEESHALQRGATIYGRILSCEISGDGMLSFDARGGSSTFAKCLARCADKARVRISDLAAVVGHGSGAAHMDQVELSGYQALLGGSRVPIQSAKGCLGELSEAGAVASLLIALDALEQKTLPPTVNFRTAPPGADVLQICSQPQSISGDAILVNTRSFGGTNCVVIIGGP